MRQNPDRRYTPQTCYAFLKPAIDAHTLGLISAKELLEDCGYRVLIADHDIQEAIVEYKNEKRLQIVLDWIAETQAAHLALSYRLDGQDAANMLGFLIEAAHKRQLFSDQGGYLKYIYYAGLPDACAIVNTAFKGRVTCLGGGETAMETLEILRVPTALIPNELKEAGQYDEHLLSFGRDLIRKQDYLGEKPTQPSYTDFGTAKDSIEKRLDAASGDNYRPLIRAHVGPYNASMTRRENVDTFLNWTRDLAAAGLLDVLSVGSSQLTQSRFGESWAGDVNGGGVPIATPDEFREVWLAARPMLVRTYAGTRDMQALAAMYEDTIHSAWHALSIWWFNRLDERGPYTLYESLREQLKTIDSIAGFGTAFEANVSHHFAFRGSDDVSYIVSSFLSAKYAKQSGIRTFIAQNMLNTPRSTWAISDIAKSRALLRLLRELESPGFRIVHQPRAGLDYFKPDLTEARAQLAAVSALMDDIEPDNKQSPPIIHVVSYSEAAHLADPPVINESIQITLHAIRQWRAERQRGYVPDTRRNREIRMLEDELYESAKAVISAAESLIPNLYSPEGFYLAFAAGFMPVPYLWRDQEEFAHAINWRTKVIRGQVRLVDDFDVPLSDPVRIETAKMGLNSAREKLEEFTKILK